MFTIDGKNIELTRGDSFSFTMTFTGRTLPAETMARFTIKKKVKDEEAVIEKTVPVAGNVAAVHLLPEDTADLKTGTYFWDMRLMIPNGAGHEVRTPMEYASFQLLEVIGDAD